MTYPCCRHCTHRSPRSRRKHPSPCPWGCADVPHAVAMDGADVDRWRCLQCDWEGPYTEATQHITTKE